VPVDTCQFSPLQLHPATALRIGMTALARCIGEQLVDWRVLKTHHRTTVVIAGVRLDYLRPFGFFSAAEIEVDAGLVVRRGGRLYQQLQRQLGLTDTRRSERKPAHARRGAEGTSRSTAPAPPPDP
jgi:hypothetical protein